MLPKRPLPFGDWRPDVALLDSQFAAIAENVYPGANSYLPFRGLGGVVPEALPGQCVGLFTARAADGTYQTYAGTPIAIYWWSGTTWQDVTRLVGTDYNVNLSLGHRWSFTQFGPHLIAVNPSDPPQVINVDTENNFTDLGGSPPWATTVSTVGDFVLLAGLVNNTRMIQWSGINDITSWTVGTDLSDEQEFPDGGPVMGAAGGEIGYILQDKSIRTMQFLPGDTQTIFSFSRVEREKGCVGPYAFIFTRGVLFLLAEDGFYGLGAPNPAIGNNAVNHWFMDNSDPQRRGWTVCFADMTHSRVFWAFYSSPNSPYYDRLIIFDWLLPPNGRWSYSTQVAQMWTGQATSPGVDLDTEIAGNDADVFLDSAEPTLDSTLYMPGRPVTAAIDVNGVLSILDGSNLAATIETAEVHLNPGQRSFVSAVYPLVDGEPVTVAIGERERLQDPAGFGVALGVESTGFAPVYSSSRLHRFRVFVPAGATWTHAQGVLVEAQADGEGY